MTLFRAPFFCAYLRVRDLTKITLSQTIKTSKGMNKKEKSARAKPIADGAEKFLGRRREILRTERRISPDGARTRPARGMTGEYEYVVNPYGLRIKVCCASCHWKQLTESLVTRKCRRLKKRVKPRHCCGFWGMSDGLRKLNIKH